MLPDEHELSFRPTYSRDQLALYVSCIAPDPSYTLSTLEAEIKADPLAALSTLQLRQMAFNPWGNVALHYSWHRTLSLDPEALFHKIVERKLGGYCMENNAFFSTVLRSLGYQLYVTGARISYALEGGANPHGFAGWQHEVILVTINGQKYLADVGFGSQPLIDAIPLIKPTAPDFSDARVYPSVPGAECRLVHRAIAPNTDPTQRLWVFETRNASKPQWAAGYCFDELEWLPGDFEIINYRTSTDPSSWFTHRLVLAKILVDGPRTRPIGTVTLNGGKIERRLGVEHGGKGGKEIVVDAKTERDRLVGLRTWFNVVLHPDEERGIKGMASEIAEPFEVSTDA